MGATKLKILLYEFTNRFTFTSSFNLLFAFLPTALNSMYTNESVLVENGVEIVFLQLHLFLFMPSLNNV